MSLFLSRLCVLLTERSRCARGRLPRLGSPVVRRKLDWMALEDKGQYNDQAKAADHASHQLPMVRCAYRVLDFVCCAATRVGPGAGVLITWLEDGDGAALN